MNSAKLTRRDTSQVVEPTIGSDNSRGRRADNHDADTIAETIISLERQALGRWNQGDVEGQLKFYADDVTYFDSITAARLDGWPAVAEYFCTVWAGARARGVH